MADTPIDRLEIEISSSSDSAVKKIEALAAALERLNGMSSAGIENIAERIKTLGSVNETISVDVDPSSITAVDSLIDRVGVLQRAIEKVNATPISVKNLPSERSQTSTKASSQEAKQSDESTVSQAAQDVEDRVGALRRSLQSIKDFLSDAASEAKALGKAFQSALPSIKSIFNVVSKVVGVVGKIAKGFLKIAKTILGSVINAVKKLASGLKTIGSHVLNYVTEPFKKAISVIQKWKSKILNVIFYRAVRTALKQITDGFKEGIENLYYFSSLVGTQFAPAMNTLSTSALYLKNSLGAMVSPLIQSVAPAVDFLVDKFVQLLNVINMVFAALGGEGTYTKAIKTAAQYGDDLSDSMGGAADSAEEFKRYLIGIDALTIIPDQTSSSGGGGSGSGLDEDYGSMFEQAALPDWVKSIKDAIADGDWYGAGELLAEKVNGLIDKLYENAPTWGNKIGTAIQNAIELGIGFIQNVDIEELGASVSTIIGNALNNINARDLGAILASGIKSVFRFAHGFLEGYTGPEIGAYLADVVNGWFEELRRDDGWKNAGADLNQAILDIINGLASFIDRLETDEIEQDLKDFFGEIKWTDIWNAVKNLAQTANEKIPWKDIFNGLLNIAGNALVFVHDTILNIPSTQATSGVWGTLKQKIKNGEPVTFLDVISGLTAFFSDIIIYVSDAAADNDWKQFWTELKDNIAKMLGADDWDDLKTQIKEKIVNVLTEAFDLASDTLYEVLSEKYPKIMKILFPKKTTEKYGYEYQQIMETQGEDAASKFVWGLAQEGKISNTTAAEIMIDASKGIYDNADLLTTATEDAVGNIDDVLTDAGFGNSAARTLSLDFTATTTSDFDTVTTEVKGTNSKSVTLTAKVEDINSEVREKVSDAWASIKDKTSTLISTVKDTASNVREKVSDAWASIKDKASTLKSTVKDTTSKAREKVTDAWDSIKDKASTLKGKFTDTTSKVREALSDAWSNLKDKTATLKANFTDSNSSTRKTLESAWQNLKDKTSSLRASFTDVTSGVRETLESAWDKLVNKTSTLKASFSDIASSTRKTLESAWDKLIDKSSTLKASFSDIASSVRQKLVSAWDTIVDKTSTLTGKAQNLSSSILSTLKSAWDTIVTKTTNLNAYANNKNSSVLSTIKSAWETIKTKTVTLTANILTSASNAIKKLLGLSTGGIYAGGKWHSVQGYASGGNPRSARLFYANENGIPELVGRIGSNTAVLNNSQIVASVASGVYRAVSAAMGGLGSYFSNIAAGISRIPDALSNIELEQAQPLLVGAGEPSYQQMDTSGLGSPNYDDYASRSKEDKEDLINAIYAMGQRLITAIQESGGDLIMDGDKLGTRTTDVQNRQTKIYGRSVVL